MHPTNNDQRDTNLIAEQSIGLWMWKEVEEAEEDNTYTRITNM